MPDHDADVLIVGAGPAGAWAARQLALGGASVRLIDASHPREKPCGGGLTERCVVMLGGVVERVPHVAIERVRFESPPVGRDPYPPPPRTPPSVTVDVPRGAPGKPVSPLVVVSRRAFDAALVDDAREAGADLIPERAVDVHVDEGSVSVSTRQRRWRGRYLIGADGANSLVRRRLHTPLPASHWSLATGVFADGRAAPRSPCDSSGSRPATSGPSRARTTSRSASARRPTGPTPPNCAAISTAGSPGRTSRANDR